MNFCRYFGRTIFTYCFFKTTFYFDDDDASITTTQINALADRNKERVARLQKWKEETAASQDPRISQSNATEDPDQVLDAFKERIANEERQKSERKTSDHSEVNPEPVRSGSPHEAEHQTGRNPSARKSRGESRAERKSRGTSRSKNASRKRSESRADEV